MMQTLKPSLVSLPPLPQKSQNPNPIIPAAGDDHRRHDPNHLRTIHTLIDQCTSTRHLEQIHAHILTTGSISHSYTATKLFTACALSSFSSLDYALKVFEDMPQPNLYSWNTLIRAFASSHEPIIGVLMFIRMLKESELCPNNFTFPFVIKAAAADCELRVGQSVHGLVVKGGSDLDVFTMNSLIHFYAMCGDLDSAWLVFGRIVEKDVVSWNSMINGFGQGGCPDKAVELFKRMEMEHVRPNAITVVSLLSACARKGDLEFGRWVCEYIERNGIGVNLNVSNAMLDLYVKCGSIEDAKRLFDEMEEKDVVSWTTMIDGYAKIGEYEMARSVFYAMPRQEITAWNVLISAYEQNGKPKEALAIFRELQLRENVKPDKVTLLSTLSACAQLGALDLGVWIHLYIEKQGIKLNCHLTTALIDMYSKSGELKKALDVFYSAERRDIFVWSSMISGLAMHGRGREAIDLFVKMQEAKVKPNVVTFTNLLAACSHSGLVDEGKAFFGQMEPVYGIVPGSRHYACMVDVLARAGHLEEAFEFAEKMPIEPSASVWVALLGACRVLENVELAEKACTRLLKIEPENHGAYVLLSNIYAKTGKWNSVSGLRHDMKVSGLKKEPGCSSIEVNGTIHEFRVGDNSHHLSKDIYSKLDEIIGTLKSKGYVPNKSHLLQCIEEEDMKEIALNHHSEKLAIAFGLISTGPSQPIRIVKNIRVCGDCHTVAKLISKLYKREILLRDRYRYHHFSGGQCSCKDFW